MWLFLCCTAQFANFRFCMWYFGALSFSHLYVQAARETGALQAAKNKLEKQVEELTWRLQLEKRMRVSINMTTNLLKVVFSCCIIAASHYLTEHAVRSMNFLRGLSIFWNCGPWPLEVWLSFQLSVFDSNSWFRRRMEPHDLIDIKS